jgi:hypothetical protein
MVDWNYCEETDTTGSLQNYFLEYVRMKLSFVFKRVLLQTVDRLCPSKRTGRPRILENEEALDCMFKVLRTGMQWREIECVLCNCTSPDGNLEQPWHIRNGLQEGIGHLQKAAAHD